MEIRGFRQGVRIGEYPVSLDIDGAETDFYGIKAVFRGPAVPVTSTSGRTLPGRVELRQKGDEYALFIFRYSDAELPGWWQDSELVWKMPRIEESEL